MKRKTSSKLTAKMKHEQKLTKMNLDARERVAKMQAKTSKSRNRTIGTVATELAASSTAKHAAEQKTKRAADSNRAAIAKAAIAKWNGVISNTPESDITDGSQGQGQNNNTATLNPWDYR